MFGIESVGSEIRSNVFYYYFLKSLVYAVRHLPPNYARWVLQAAKVLVGFFPMISILLVSLSSVLVQSYFLRSKAKSTKETASVVNEDEKIEKLEQLMKGEQNERQTLQKSSEILMECIKGLQRKLDTEIICRKSYQREADKQKDIYSKKVEAIEERLDYLKSSLKRSITGMDRVLCGIKDTRCEAAGDFSPSEKPDASS